MRMSARYGLPATIAVVVLAMLAGPAVGRDRINSIVTIGTGETATGQEFLKGRVNSPKPKCERNRNVVLYWNDPDLARHLRPR